MYDKRFGASDWPQLAQRRDCLRFFDYLLNDEYFSILKSVISAHFGKGTKNQDISKRTLPRYRKNSHGTTSCPCFVSVKSSTVLPVCNSVSVMNCGNPRRSPSRLRHHHLSLVPNGF